MMRLAKIPARKMAKTPPRSGITHRLKPERTVPAARPPKIRKPMIESQRLRFILYSP